MADFTPIGALIKPQQPMSLGDVVNIAQGAQAYQQAQKINPLQLQQEQYKAQQAQLGQQDTQALNQFMSDPTNWQDENGKIDINKINKTVPKIAPYLGAQFISTMSTLSKNETDALDASQNLETKQRGIIAGALGATGRQNITDPNVYKSELDNLVQLYPNNKDIQKLAQSTKNIIDNLPQGSSLPNFAIKFGQSLLTSSEQQTQLSPKAETVNLGGRVQPVVVQPSVGANAPSITQAPGAMGTTLPPQLQVDSAGNIHYFGGSAGAPNQTTTVPQVPSAGGVQPQPGTTSTPWVNKPQANIIEDVRQMPKQAVNALDSTFLGSATNMMYTNDKILHLLDDPKLDVGPIANAVAKGSNNVSMTPDQQLVAKYLEQRIQQRGARSDQDLASAKTAFGNFGTDKDALREILYADKGQLLADKLKSAGILNRQGDPNMPNYNAINNFNTQFTSMANPRLLHFMGIIGNKSVSQLTEADKNSLKKNFSGLTKEQFNDLLNQRDNLLKFVNGQ